MSLNCSNGKLGQERADRLLVFTEFPSVWGIFLYLPLNPCGRTRGGKDGAVGIRGYVQSYSNA